MTLVACATPPTADIDAAKTAISGAEAAGAAEYAADSLKAAQDAQAALDAELKAQEGQLDEVVRQGQGTRDGRQGCR